MKKHIEKAPIDDLFARKLGNMSMPPSADGFERLQRRMNPGEAEPRLVFWRNPQMQRYMAIAACLLLVCLFGWLYQSDSAKLTDGQQVAQSPAKQPTPDNVTPSNVTDNKTERAADADVITPNVVSPETPGNPSATDYVAVAPVPTKNGKSASKPTGQNNLSLRSEATYVAPDNVAQTSPFTRPENVGATSTTVAPVPSAPAADQVAANQPKPAASTERSLIVTIDEPDALVAARQAARESAEAKSTVAVHEKAEKESKGGNLWQQVQRIRSGDVFARSDRNEDERGLLGRAYAGLKHSIEKDKPTKQ